MLRHAQPDDRCSTGPRVFRAVSMGGFTTAPGSTIQDFLKNHGALLCGYLVDPLHYMHASVSAIEYDICPSFLLVVDPGNDLKWRVISASHLYAQYIICAMDWPLG